MSSLEAITVDVVKMEDVYERLRRKESVEQFIEMGLRHRGRWIRS